MSLHLIPDATSIPERLAILCSVATANRDRPELIAFTNHALRRAARAVSFNKPTLVDVARALLKDAQDLPYRHTGAGEQIEDDVGVTIREGGDCKALSVLLAAAGLRVGLKPEFEWIRQDDAPWDHVALWWSFDRRGGWADASVRGGLLGEHPFDALVRLGLRTIGPRGFA